MKVYNVFLTVYDNILFNFIKNLLTESFACAYTDVDRNRFSKGEYRERYHQGCRPVLRRICLHSIAGTEWLYRYQ